MQIKLVVRFNIFNMVFYRFGYNVISTGHESFWFLLTAMCFTFQKCSKSFIYSNYVDKKFEQRIQIVF